MNVYFAETGRIDRPKTFYDVDDKSRGLRALTPNEMVDYCIENNMYFSSEHMGHCSSWFDEQQRKLFLEPGGVNNESFAKQQSALFEEYRTAYKKLMLSDENVKGILGPWDIVDENCKLGLAASGLDVRGVTREVETALWRNVVQNKGSSVNFTNESLRSVLDASFMDEPESHGVADPGKSAALYGVSDKAQSGRDLPDAPDFQSGASSERSLEGFVLY